MTENNEIKVTKAGKKSIFSTLSKNEKIDFSYKIAVLILLGYIAYQQGIVANEAGNFPSSFSIDGGNLNVEVDGGHLNIDGGSLQCLN